MLNRIYNANCPQSAKLVVNELRSWFSHLSFFHSIFAENHFWMLLRDIEVKSVFSKVHNNGSKVRGRARKSVDPFEHNKSKSHHWLLAQERPVAPSFPYWKNIPIDCKIVWLQTMESWNMEVSSLRTMSFLSHHN